MGLEKLAIYKIFRKNTAYLLFTFLSLGLLTPLLSDEVIKLEQEKLVIFNKLPKSKDLKKNNNVGKIDIFSFGDSSTNLSLSLKLLGIYESKKRKYAIVNYNENVGEITQGDLGGKDTIFLPNNFELININLEKFSIVVKSKNKLYEIKG